jgi:hypothetical protein
VGIAAIFEQWFSPTHGGGLPNHATVLLVPGCLDRSLARIREGCQAFRLLVAHDSDWPIISYSAGCVLLSQMNDQLRLTVLPFGSAGRAACREIRNLAASGFNELSVGLTPTKFDTYGSRVFVTRARLHEVSLVLHGANHGCRFIA